MNLIVHKKTGTYADTLHAIGLAHLGRELCNDNPEIIDKGSVFEVSIQNWHPEKWSSPTPGYLYIWDSQKEPKPPEGPVLNYRAEIEKRKAITDAAKLKAKTRQRIKSNLEEQGLEAPEPPQLELGLATILASMRKGWNSDHQLYRWLSEDKSRALAWTKEKLAIKPLEIGNPDWSNTQFLNPVTGKGIHSSKTMAKSANAINAALVDPFEDWMKIRGAFIAMLPYRDDDDFKMFVIEPAHATPAAIERIGTELRGLHIWGGVRLDIHALLRCTEILIRHSDVVASGPVLLKNRRPNDIISGLRQAYFKSLGTAAALMNDTLFPLPDWFAISTVEDANQMLEIIDEFIGSSSKPSGCLGSLDEKKSDEGAVLQQFRNWLATGDLTELLNFHAAFASHLMQKRARRDWCKPFTTNNLTILLSKRYTTMTEIVNNPGFQNIARAIRNSTIYSVGDGAPSQVSTQFGLAQKWKQKLRAGKAEFLAEVAEFAQQYNWEVINRLKRRYYVIQTQDLDQLTALIKASENHETVGLLLLAYGYAQAPKTETNPQGEN